MVGVLHFSLFLVCNYFLLKGHMTIICYVYCIFVGLLVKVMELPACTDYVQFAKRLKSMGICFKMMNSLVFRFNMMYVVGTKAFKIVTRVGYKEFY